jgi:hypothetical protein
VEQATNLQPAHALWKTAEGVYFPETRTEKSDAQLDR